LGGLGNIVAFFSQVRQLNRLGLLLALDDGSAFARMQLTFFEQRHDTFSRHYSSSSSASSSFGLTKRQHSVKSTRIWPLSFWRSFNSGSLITLGCVQTSSLSTCVIWTQLLHEKGPPSANPEALVPTSPVSFPRPFVPLSIQI